MTEYFANIEAINATEIGCTPHGTAKFNENESTLHIEIEMYDTPPKIEHWAHFHGFPDEKMLQLQLRIKILIVTALSIS